MWAFIAVAVLVIVLMSVFVLGLVFGDIGRTFSPQWQPRRLVLACLFSGIVAFTLKLTMVLLLDSNGQLSLPQVLQHEAHTLRAIGAPMREQRAAPILTHADEGPYRWQTFSESVDQAHTADEWVKLGDDLFHDKNLSQDRTIACASCHDVWQRAGTDGLPTSLGIARQKGSRNAPTVWNSAYQRVLFWDGRAHSLEEQAKGPPTNPIEMGLPDHAAMVARVVENADYTARFERLTGQSTVTLASIVGAIADYERTLLSQNTPYDRYIRGDRNALNPVQQRGMRLFAGLGCVACHSGPNFSEASRFSQASPYRLFPASNMTLAVKYGLIASTPGQAPQPLVLRVPSLRNVALTAPYFHNGTVTPLSEAVKIMAQTQLGLHYDEQLPEQNEPWRTRQIGPQEVKQLVAFLNSLSDPRLLKNPIEQ